MPLFNAVILLEPHGAGTKYIAVAIHGDEEGAKQLARATSLFPIALAPIVSIYGPRSGGARAAGFHLLATGVVTL